MQDTTSDHDLLIEIKTELRLLRDSIASESKETSRRIADHELRLRALERSKWVTVGGASVVATLINFIVGKL